MEIFIVLIEVGVLWLYVFYILLKTCDFYYMLNYYYYLLMMNIIYYYLIKMNKDGLEDREKVNLRENDYL